MWTGPGVNVKIGDVGRGMFEIWCVAAGPTLWTWCGITVEDLWAEEDVELRCVEVELDDEEATAAAALESVRRARKEDICAYRRM